MKVKIGDVIYSSLDQPIMIVLNSKEKDQITNMSPDATKYASFPETEHWCENDFKRIKEWMLGDFELEE